MPYRRCGRSGLRLPAISLGLWQNFGDDRPLRAQPRDPAPRVRPGHHALRPRQQLRAAVRQRREELRPHLRARTSAAYRDELVISTKAGYDMWPGPVRRVGLAQVPARQPRPEPARGWASTTSTSSTRTASTRTRRCEETMGALDSAVRAGKARYVGISSYGARAHRARRSRSWRELGTPLLIHQPSYSMLNRWIEDGLLDVLGARGRRRDRLLAARAGPAHRPLPARRPRGLARARAANYFDERDDQRGEPRARPRARRDRRASAARRSRSWRSPGCCATRASPRRCSAPAASSSSSRTSRALQRLDFTAEELAAIDRHAQSRAASTSGRPPATAEGRPQAGGGEIPAPAGSPASRRP